MGFDFLHMGIQSLVKNNNALSRHNNNKTDQIQLTCTAVSAATIAGDPNPCVIIEKWVRLRWIEGSRI